ncbi:YppF family protein [Cytobacillus sp. FSL W7-1323]|uniref:YppF-like protein n=1 Tax=Cytobacillus kochii TaxID=859143 RepID=A0A248TM14_9BACI|nr:MULTISPECIES: YppF family protein [Cytobacillus]ASV69236.1 hypothetical protein CKF48_19135 [Cytobacillus kochii]MCA1027148.1 YppF family protein [Cytobacillus kochii]MCM3320818.1 YppF family protein [Cytobacillus kochii]MCM3344348.1 YppF family protein [Cytobacillus kochii]MDM5208193.1 YppF family protein [Cytobacillus kochii]
MNIHELKQKFQQVKEVKPDHANQLLDFSKRAYIHNEISILDYRNLVRELESLGAVIPESFFKDGSLITMK